MQVLAAALAALVLAGCRDRTPSHPAAIPTAAVPPAPSADSIARDRAAAALFGPHERDSMEVERYTEDSAGTLVSLFPACPPPPGGCAGGGGLVRIDKKGKAHVVTLYR
jgi:hypothetical protein